ncbi:DUF1810 domain-containing protein [Frigoribacterium salinisoli]
MTDAPGATGAGASRAAGRAAAGGGGDGGGGDPFDGDAFDLRRFVRAQSGGVHEQAVAELRAGEKRSHWMWFTFPQLAGLGRSSTAQHYALTSLDEARAYLAHPVLGERLREVAGVVADSGAASADELLGSVDALKLRSSATLFARAAPDEAVFARVLERWFDGRADAATDELLAR